MGRRKQLLPTLRFHKPTGQHYYWDSFTKTRVNLGANKERAERRYKAAIAKLASDRADAQTPTLPPTRNLDRQISVAELALEYTRRAVPDYRDNRDAARIRAGLLHLSRFAGIEEADRFSAQRLKEFRRHLAAECRQQRDVTKPFSRTYINYLVGVVKMVWAWASENEYIRTETAFRVRGVRPLRRGQGGAERVRVPPVEDWVIDATVPELGPIVAAMVRVQQFTGARPGEICGMRRRDLSIDTSEAVAIPETKLEARANDRCWMFVPAMHKNSGRGKARVLAIGPRCQAVLSPFVVGKRPDDAIFSPAAAALGHLKRLGRSFDHLRHVSHRATYDRSTFAWAVTRAIERVNRKRLAAGCLLLSGSAGLLPHWSPGQIRHTTATAVRARFGREATAEYLGHAGLDLVDRYAEQAIETAVRIAAEMG